MNLKWIKERANDMGAKVIQIYQGNVTTTDGQFPVFSVRENEQTDVMLDKFGQNFAGNFTAFLRLDKNQNRASGERITFYHNPTGNDALPMQQTPINGNVDRETIRKEILAEVQKQNEENELRNRLKDLEDELRYNKRSDDRLLSIGQQLMEMFAPNLLKKNGDQARVIQGTKPNSKPMAEEPEEETELTPEESKQLEAALDTICDVLPFETIIKVAKALKERPQLAKQLDAFL